MDYYCVDDYYYNEDFSIEQINPPEKAEQHEKYLEKVFIENCEMELVPELAEEPRRYPEEDYYYYYEELPEEEEYYNEDQEMDYESGYESGCNDELENEK